MTTPARAPYRTVPNARRVPRCPLSVPIRVTVPGSADPIPIPGRALNLGEGGIAAILAGEVHPGDTVGVEFLLPEMGLGLHTKGIVRHHADLRCGVEFFGLSLEQQAMIRRWTRRVLEKQSAAKTASSVTPAPITAEPASDHLQPGPVLPKLRPGRYKWLIRVFALLVVALAVCGLVAWRYWQMGWVELQRPPSPPVNVVIQHVKLPPGVMDGLVMHKVDAVYPEGTAESNGMVLVQIVVGADGTVIDEHPLSGPKELTRAAMEAVKEWRFQPYRVNGMAAEVETTVVVGFTP